MINPDLNDRTTGFLVLLFFLLLPILLKPARSHQDIPVFPHDERIYIQIDGDIKTPGLYPFGHPVSLAEVIERAGGLPRDAPPHPIFNTHSFQTNTRVILHKKGNGYRFTEDDISAFYKLTLGIPISLNGESEEGLTAIPGIGPGLARNLVEERIRRGGFKSLNEIMSVKGIGQKTYRKMSPYLTL